ncbi:MULTISPECIES: gas vesicle protein GvpG [unclassified Roseofilum]|uniref:gas vesicle protein GvpG n=1 Tax=unclassified Roseofilum TaxID=2620099 RepID=UPI000E9DF957|nr:MULTISPECIES: gas vesicle protein GvpG [unclassified Roseofilum]HBQ98528.1 gas vesicle protein GvpG [Cyanobacteria bacterium UBA11691]MBP0009886.1 gas vesicle protein GvpG [Roseofilum sp. Belize Diploria]MBP0012554.1 gas vesicle protein GvpG [Roseofilum sp. SID3]MBP0024264.1 gas vesicle protein GvpG [Roseofilum sp. SID2]MBP0034417.1 gas vesicle protein GvpG [Roseofilum sp. Belize BBD 4]
MILRLLTLPVLGPIEGMLWIGEQVLEHANAELNDKEDLNKQLLTLQLAFDMGELSEEEFEEQEEALLLAIQELEEENNE